MLVAQARGPVANTCPSCPAEPSRGQSDRVRVDGPPPTLGAVARYMLARKSYRHMIIAGMLLNVATAGILQFLHAHFQRAFGMAYAEAAYTYGLASGLSLFVGLLAGGLLTNRFGDGKPRTYLMIPAVGMAIAATAFPVAFMQSDWRICAALAFVGGAAASAYFGPLFATAHNLAKPHMRATVTALSALVMNGLGIAGGPLLIGFLSDRAAAFAYSGIDYRADCSLRISMPNATCQSASAEGLQIALMISGLLYLWAGIHFMISSFHIESDVAVADAR